MFLYYIPGLSRSDLTTDSAFNRGALPAKLAEVLLDCDKITDHVVLSDCRNGIGPGATSGVMLSPVSKKFGSPVNISFAPGVQTWKPVEDSQQNYWIGINNDQPPTPDLLRRNDLITGMTVEDDSQRQWYLPVARAPGHPYGSLRTYYDFNDLTGEVESILKRDQQAIWDFGAEIWDWYRAEFNAQSAAEKDSTLPHGPDAAAAPEATAARPDLKWLITAALRILQINYRVGRPELRFLGSLSGPVLTDDTVFVMTQGFIGWDLLDEYAKKKTAGTNPLNESPSTAGAPTPTESHGIDQLTRPST